jgi:recombination protein U
MANAFEVETSYSLRSMDKTWFIKIPDSPFGTYQSRPFDFIFVSRGKTVCIECKQTRTSTSFPLQNIRAHQVAELAEVEYLGCSSYLLVNVRATKGSPRVNELYALTPEQVIYWFYMQSDRASIPTEWMRENCINISRIKIDKRYGWDLSILIKP